jgi:hypothetical protein
MGLLLVANRLVFPYLGAFDSSNGFGLEAGVSGNGFVKNTKSFSRY